MEVYSSYHHKTDVFNYGIDGGLAFVFAKKYQLDLAAGYGLGNSGEDFFLNLGFSFLVD